MTNMPLKCASAIKKHMFRTSKYALRTASFVQSPSVLHFVRRCTLADMNTHKLQGGPSRINPPNTKDITISKHLKNPSLRVISSPMLMSKLRVTYPFLEKTRDASGPKTAHCSSLSSSECSSGFPACGSAHRMAHLAPQLQTSFRATALD